MNLHQILHQAWTFLCRNYSDDSEGCSYRQLVIGSFIMTTHPLTHHVSCSLFGKTPNRPDDSALLQPRFGALQLLAFAKTKITFEREEISDCWWGSGKYNGAADSNWENCVRSQWNYFEGDWGTIVLCTMFLLSSSINVSIFRITWLDTFWTDLVFLPVLLASYLRNHCQIQCHEAFPPCFLEQLHITNRKMRLCQNVKSLRINGNNHKN